MKKKLYMTVLAAALMLSAAACGKTEEPAEDPSTDVKSDVIEFVNVELPAAKADHDSAVATYNAYFAQDNELDLAGYKASLSDTAIPAMESCIQTITDIEVATSQVETLKSTYLQSVQKEYEAMKMVVSAIDGQNADYLTQAEGLISEAETLMSDYQTQLQTIADAQGIVVSR